MCLTGRNALLVVNGNTLIRLWSHLHTRLKLSPPSFILFMQTMSTDQNLLYRTCRALIDGVCDSSLARRKIGKISFARWLTLAIRINMCYMSTRKPSTGLVILTKFVVTIYAKLWFGSKLCWKASDAPSLYFKAMKLIAKLKDSKPKITSEKFKKVKDTFGRGFGYWGHSENILLAMLASENKNERARAVARISTLRGIQRQGQEKEKSAQAEDEEKEDSVQIFQTSLSQSYEEMIDWDKEQVCPPPYVQFHTDEEIQEYVVTEAGCSFQFSTCREIYSSEC